MENKLVPYEAVSKIDGQRVLVLAPHPDDEVFGCAGAIMRHVAAGDLLQISVVSDGAYHVDATQRTAYAEVRREESRQAALILNCAAPEFWGFPDRGVEYGEQLVRRIEEAIGALNADLVYAPSVFEMHPDHRALGMAAMEAVRRHEVRPKLAQYEVGVAMLRPNRLLDISDLVERKQSAMACFASQLREQAYDQHIGALNRYRTYTLGAQTTAAEAYFVTTAEALQADILGLYQSEHTRQRALGLPMLPTDMPLVSVMIRSMDRSTLRVALDSVALQTYPHIEVVVVNAKGIGHDTLGDWCGRFPLRLVGTGASLKRSPAANQALAAARGKYLVFLDDDDWFEPHHVGILVEKIQAEPRVKAVYANVQVVGALGEYLDHVFKEEFDALRLMADNLIPIHAILFDRSLVDAGCLFDESLDVYEDWDFWLQISQLTDFSHVDRVGAYYLAEGNSEVGPHGTVDAKTQARALVFEKWKTLWSGGQIDALLKHKDSLTLTKIREMQANEEIYSQQLNQQLRAQGESLTSVVKQLEALLKGDQARLLEQASVIETLNRGLEESESRSTGLKRQMGEIHSSTSWRVTMPLRWAGTKALNAKHVVSIARQFIRANGGGSRGTLKLLGKSVETLRKYGPLGLVFKVKTYARHAGMSVPGFTAVYSASVFNAIARYGVAPHGQSVAIIVCIHNALPDVKRCLESVMSHTYPPYTLILVDDGSDVDTQTFLQQFAAAQGATLIRNPTAKGYTLAANQGLQSAAAEYAVLLNSDTVVSEQWLDRMIMCAESDPRIGVVGPLSNTASWQSVPDILVNGDWADNALPDGMSIDTMATLVAGHSARLHPRVPLLNGFCLLIKRTLIDNIGIFDEESFAQGYGEENDYCLRARAAGWSLALADDVYVYHAQSKSYSHERRKILSQRAGEILAHKHGQSVIDQSVAFCRYDRVLEGLRIGVKSTLAEYAKRTEAKLRWEGKRVLFFLPTADAGGGSNVVISEVLALISFGVDARLANYTCNLSAFERSYSGIQVPRVYVADDAELLEVVRGYDAVVATVNTTVPSLAKVIQPMTEPPVVGYYVQDYEPWFYKAGSTDYKSARGSYGLIQNMVLFTKTQWNERTVKEQTGMECIVIGPSFNGTLFRPRLRKEPSWPERALRVVAMIRPYTPRRAPKLTMEVLRDACRKYGERIEVVLFGEESDHPDFASLPQDFKWRNLGKQTSTQLASLLNESDIFIDFSEYQAMGLTAMEAMACGVAVVVPSLGGATSFAEHGKNALLVDSSNQKECLNALSRLIEDDVLRTSMQQQAMHDVSPFRPDVAADNLMRALFPIARANKEERTC